MENYRRYTSTAEHNKALNMLQGIVEGLNVDGSVSSAEMTELTHWCSLHENLRKFAPFNELLPMIEAALSDGVLTEEEKADILWVCGKNYLGKDYYDDITGTLQVLSGIAHGMLADQELNDAEIHALSEWVNHNDFLKGYYPFDEIDAMLCSVLSDKIISTEERESLMALLSSLVEFKDSYNLIETDFEALRLKYSVGGICAVAPHIEFENRAFCVTGDSYKASRKEIKDLIAAKGGLIRDKVTKATDYLIICDGGNPCWAYACYGRKVESAMQIRRAGGKVQLIAEVDLWDALEE